MTRQNRRTRLLSSDVSVLCTAPVRVSRMTTVPASPGALWAVLAEDPSAWGSWCPGFSSRSGWVAPGDPGIGSQRLMYAFGTTFLETVLEWEVATRFSFCINECGIPGIRRFVESWSMRPLADGAEVTEATWTMAVDSALPDVILRRLLSAQQAVMISVAERRLARLLRAD